jgi:hypothetical protein
MKLVVTAWKQSEWMERVFSIGYRGESRTALKIPLGGDKGRHRAEEAVVSGVFGGEAEPARAIALDEGHQSAVMCEKPAFAASVPREATA